MGPLLALVVAFTPAGYPGGDLQEACARSEPTYRLALSLMAEGRPGDAAVLLEQVLLSCPTHSSARDLLDVSRKQAGSATPAELPLTPPPLVEAESPMTVVVTPPVRPLGTLQLAQQLASITHLPAGAADIRQSTWNAARFELIAAQSLHGMAQGYTLSRFVLRTPDATTALLTLGSGGLFGLTAGIASMGGIRTNDAMLVNSGTFWGLVATLEVGILARAPAGTEWAMLFGGLAGAGTGAALAYFFDPAPGQIALVNSVAFWVAAIATWSGTMLQPPDVMTTFGYGFGGTVGGLVLGAVLARNLDLPFSRTEMLLIDVAGIAGAGLGIVAGQSLGLTRERNGFALATVPPMFTVGAMAATAYALRRLDVDAEPPGDVVLTPLGPQGAPGLSLGILWP